MKPSKRYQVISATGAFLLWGSWAYLINSNGQGALYSGICQGLVSSFLTMLMIFALSKLYTKFNTRLTKLLMPACILFLSTSIIGISVHTLINTANIFYTLTPPLLVGFIFSVTTCFKIHQKEKC